MFLAPQTIGRAALLADAIRLLPQDVFATSLYSGNGGSQAITTGQDLAGKGGLAWLKSRTTANSHGLFDTVRANRLGLSSDTAGAEGAPASPDGVNAYSSTGFTVSDVGSGAYNTSGRNYAAWSFRRAAKFFDVVTYTGNGTSGRVISHGLGIAPGMIITKVRSQSDDWIVRHRSATGELFLDATNPQQASYYFIVDATATTFSVSSNSNTNGQTFVAYLFAHDPDTTNGIIQCGSYTGGAGATVNLGWQPQFVLIKNSSSTSSWYIIDSTRGVTKNLKADLTNAEQTISGLTFNSTGFVEDNTYVGTGSTAVFCAIRAPT